jgi:hydrogenase nickel incorporation protein HypB
MCTSCGCSSEEDSPQKNHHHDVSKAVHLEQDILHENKKYAEQNRTFFLQKNCITLNFVSSPGSGKTTILERTIKDIAPYHPVAVIEGDQHTELDAQRIRLAGAQAYQINTGKVCHLDAHMISHACTHLSIQQDSFLMIENVGNLICPAMFDLGEQLKVVVMSTTEGEDKPLKYPYIFYGADVVILNKSDLLPYTDFNTEKCIENIKKIGENPRFFTMSAKTRDGFSEWIAWLKQRI